MMRPFLYLAGVLLIAGCASSSGTYERSWPPPQQPVVIAPSDEQPAPVEQIPDPTPIETEPAALPEFPRTAEQISGAAVSSLMQAARQARDDGEPDRAAASLERALRIEPRNYFVWSMLSQIYLDQRQYEQAEAVAGKSNSLARGNFYIELENWKTIAKARDALGDAVGALQAQSKVDELQRKIDG